MSIGKHVIVLSTYKDKTLQNKTGIISDISRLYDENDVLRLHYRIVFDSNERRRIILWIPADDIETTEAG